MSTLLEQAKAVPIKAKRANWEVTKEEVDLAIAWLKGEVRTSQAATALGMHSKSQGTRLSYWINKTLSHAVRQGILVERK